MRVLLDPLASQGLCLYVPSSLCKAGRTEGSEPDCVAVAVCRILPRIWPRWSVVTHPELPLSACTAWKPALTLPKALSSEARTLRVSPMVPIDSRELKQERVRGGGVSWSR